MVKKFALIFITCCSGLGFLLIHRARSDPASQALKAYKGGQWEACVQQLARAGLPTAQQCLFEGYVCRGRGNFAQSDQALEQGLQMCQSTSGSSAAPLKLELTLNVLLNQYLQGDICELSNRLSLARKQGLVGKGLDLFEAICAEGQHQSDAALRLFQNAQPLVFSSSWMRWDFQRVFSPTWQALFQARNLLELGKTVQSRTTLDSLSDQNATAGQKEEQALLYAQSYIQEAPPDSTQLASAYYELASSYLQSRKTERVQSPQRILCEVCSRSIAQGQIESCSTLLKRLQEWRASDSLQQLASQLSNQWQDLATTPSQSLQVALDKLPLEFRGYLDQRLRIKMLNLLDQSSSSQWVNGYQNALLFAQDKSRFRAWMASDLADTSLKGLGDLKDSDTDGSQVEVALHLFQEALQGQSNAPAARSDLTLRICELIVGRADVSARAERALDTLLGGSQTKNATLQAVLASEIKQKFEKALAAKDFDQMSRLCDLSNSHQLAAIPRFTTPQVSEVLGDAEYCLSSNQTARAVSQLRWILKVMPDHREATAQLVNALCAQRHFAQALEVIEKARRSDLTDRQVFCLIQLGQINQALMTSQKASFLSDATLENLGQTACQAGAISKGIECLTRIGKPSQEVFALLTSACYVDAQFEMCWEAYQHLNAYKARDCKLKACALISLIELRRDHLAASLASSLFAAQNQQLSALGQEPLLNTLEPIAAVSRYYRERLQDFARAQACLNLTSAPGFATRVERVRLLLETDRAPQALQLVEKDLSSAQGDELELLKALHCRALMGCGYSARALTSAQQLATTSHLPPAAGADCALVLQQLACWDAALKLIDGQPNQRDWSCPPALQRLRCLGELGRFSEGLNLVRGFQNAKCTDWTAFEHYQLAICGLKSLIGCSESPLQPAAAKAQDLTPKRRAEIAQYYLDIGDLESAKLTQRGVGSLALSPTGRFVLASIGALSGDQNAHEVFAKAALDPLMPSEQQAESLRALVRLEQPDQIKSALEKLEQRLQVRPSDGALFRCARAALALQDSAALLENCDPKYQIQAKATLQGLEKSLRECAQQAPQLIESQILLAQVLLALNQPEQAQSIFAAALAIDVWSGPANFGRAQDPLQSLDERVNYMQRACNKSPERADYWQDLGKLLVEQFRTSKATTVAQSAKNAYLRANLLDPKCVQVYFGMARLVALEGETQSAIKLLQAGLDKAPSAKRVQLTRDLPPDLRALANLQQRQLLAVRAN